MKLTPYVSCKTAPTTSYSVKYWISFTTVCEVAVANTKAITHSDEWTCIITGTVTSTSLIADSSGMHHNHVFYIYQHLRLRCNFQSLERINLIHIDANKNNCFGFRGWPISLIAFLLNTNNIWCLNSEYNFYKVEYLNTLYLIEKRQMYNYTYTEV